MLRATPKSWFSSGLTVADGRQHVADIDISWWREKGAFTVEGARYEAYRESLLNGAFLLSSGQATLARAEKPSAFRRTLFIESQGRQYTLRAKSAFHRQLLLEEGARGIGSLSPGGALSRRVDADLPETLPVPLALFILWLTAITWRRDAHAHSM